MLQESASRSRLIKYSAFGGKYIFVAGAHDFPVSIDKPPYLVVIKFGVVLRCLLLHLVLPNVFWEDSGEGGLGAPVEEAGALEGEVGDLV